MEDKIDVYLKEIAEVSKRHGLFVFGCDCCGSVLDSEGKVVREGTVKYDEELDTYTVD